VQSPEGVGMVDRPAIAWAEELARRAAAGERVVVLHSQACQTENVTNPVCVLERLYVRLGHERFRARVVAVDVPDGRYVILPVVDVHTVLGSLAPGQLIDLDMACLPTMTEPLQALRARFTLEPVESQDARVTQFRLAPPGEPQEAE
jgi:hypothetical protein